VTSQLPRLHAITNDKVLQLPDFLERVRQVAEVPGTAVHIRSGSATGRRLTELAESALCARRDGLVFVNARADVARIVGAAGVHLPSSGLPVPQARAIVGQGCWVGRSAHSADEVLRAADEGADYVFLGPIWPTSSHHGAQPLGPGALAGGSVPVFAIGGVTPDRVAQCLDFGAYGVAVISAVWNAADVASAVRALSLSFPP